MNDRSGTDHPGGGAGRHILITGSPGVGKTTLITAIVGRLPGTKTGFVTREIREATDRKGFVIETFDGRTALLAELSTSGSPRVGKYRVLTESIRTVAVPSMAGRADYIVIDEIGKMETACEEFIPAVYAALSGRATVIATVPLRGTPDTEQMKRRVDVLLFEVTRRNRDSIADEILEKLRGVPTRR